jgi:hypothetical protein
METKDLLRSIKALQAIQMRNSPKSAKWQKASEFLAPMFAEMARRQNAGLLS